ncbi:hypothetical protein, partial [Streptomyces brasiliscabiei]|uniref:hypothetical protein n=1 Tax=Streptomyces brasiliscabiei TaxID=2736302 RepID=UPI00301443A5
QLKPYIVWWDNPAEAREKLATGDVLLEAAPVETLLGEAHAAKPAYRFTWSQSLGRTAYWAIAHGAAHEVEAQAVIAAAADPVR